MKGTLRLVLSASIVILAGLACGKPNPIVPKQPVPPGTLLVYFTRKVQGPLDLIIDGNRVPVTAVTTRFRSKFRNLEVTGLAPGRHRFVLLSPKEAFGPDQFELVLGKAKGEFKVLFAQNLQSVLYGAPEPVPAAAGLAGVEARLEP